MKKIMVILMVLLLAFAGSALAAKKSKKAMSDFEKAIKGVGFDWVDDKDNIITFSLSYNTLYAHYETKLSKGNGLGFNAHFGWYGTTYWGWTSFGIGAEYNWYFQNHALNGWFAGPGAYVSIISYHFDDTYWTTLVEDEMAFSLGIGGQGGYRWIWDNGLTVSLSLGLFVNIGGSTSYADFDAFTPRPGGSIGYAW